MFITTFSQQIFFNEMIIYIYIYIYIYIPLFCQYRVLMVDILSYFGCSTFLGYKLRLFRVNSDIFIIFRVHPVQLQKVPLNRNLKNGVVLGCPEG